MGAVLTSLAVKFLRFLVKHGTKAALLGVIIVYRVTRYTYRAKKRAYLEPQKGKDIDHKLAPCLDIRRTSQIAYGKATNHTGEVILAPMANFDIDKTIFGSVTNPLTRMALKNKLAVELYWCDHTIIRVSQAFQSIPSAPEPERAIIDFMHNDCNFAMEHADGSFLDHLNFCAHYSSVHYPQYSPRVLFLHSIMGVGTNFFPMEKAKIPDLKALLSSFEYNQIEAFPSILRLLYARALLNELLGMDRTKLRKLERINFHRVIDNEKLSMSGDQFWIQLNIQLIHLLDFLPAASWDTVNKGDSFLVNFTDIRNLLTKADKLEAKVDHDITSGETGSDGAPVTLGTYLQRIIPTKIKLDLSSKAVKKFSEAIGHSLKYTLTFSV